MLVFLYVKTSLVSTAIDRDVNTKQKVVTQLLGYLNTDSICYQESYPHSLVELQLKYWLPILNWAQKTYDIEIKTTGKISGLKQPESTIEKLKNIIENFDFLKLTGKRNYFLYTYLFLFNNI
jgi:ATP synthase F1 complex assembly factor 2